MNLQTWQSFTNEQILDPILGAEIAQKWYQKWSHFQAHHPPPLKAPNTANLENKREVIMKNLMELEIYSPLERKG